MFLTDSQYPGRLRLFVLAIAAIAFLGCGGDEDESSPTAPVAPAFVVGSGTFDVTNVHIVGNCAPTVVHPDTFDITINGTDFSVDPMMKRSTSGTWDAKKLTGNGEWGRSVTIIRNVCTVTSYWSVSIKFSSEDEFRGHISFRRRLSANCDAQTECTATWTVHGVRRLP